MTTNGKCQSNLTDTITVLADLFPACFTVFEQERRPLKIGIHLDVLAALDGAITPKECAKALRVYCANRCYLQSCVENAPRIDLDGNAVGTITAEEASHARRRLAQRKAKQQRRLEAEAKAKEAAERKARNAGRISLRDLREAAAARKAAIGV
jgi:ProP effector